MRPRFLLVPLLLLAACNESPTEPRRGTLELRMSCSASGSNVECFAWTFGQGLDRIVTNEASWLHEGAPGSFAKPGLFVPSSNGEVAIWVTYQGIVYDLRARFLVGPGQPARRLYWLAGTVSDARTGALIPNATVRITEGVDSGRTAVTNANGYYVIEPIVTGETFTITASKDGYAPHTRTYRVDPPVGANGNPPFLGFQLTPLQ